MNIKFILILGLTLSSIQLVFSQTYTVPVTVKTPYGNMTTYETRGFPQYNLSRSTSGTPEHKYTIVLKDSQVVESTAMIITRDRVHFLDGKVDRVQRSFYPHQTEKISIKLSSGRELTGIPSDSCWYFLCDKGRINSYAVFPVEKIQYAVAIRMGEDGDLMPLTAQNLKAMMPEDTDQKIFTLIKSGKLIEAIKRYNKVKD